MKVAFVLFRQRILFRIQEAVHLISNLWLELVIILFPALLKWFDCKSCAIKARQILFVVKRKFFRLYLTHLDVVGFKKKRAEEREKGSQKATEKKL